MTTKIKLVALFAMAAIGTTAGVQALSSNAEDNQSALAIANVEALTKVEAADGIPCYSSAYKDECARYVSCASCTDQIGWYGYGTEGICRR